jgi:hypothetical protein
MRKSFLLALTLVSMTLTSLNTSAASDTHYPAADFQPSVIYQAPSIATKETSQEANDPKYPASNFTPSVIFIDKQAANQSEEVFDPKYPAANFKPRVIYP